MQTLCPSVTALPMLRVRNNAGSGAFNAAVECGHSHNTSQCIHDCKPELAAAVAIVAALACDVAMPALHSNIESSTACLLTYSVGSAGSLPSLVTATSTTVLCKCSMIELLAPSV